MTAKEINLQTQHEVNELKEKIEKIETDLKKIDKGVDKILFHLNSDKDTNKEGVIEQVNRLDKEVSILKELKGKVITIAATISFIIGGAFAIIKFIFK